MHRTILLRNPTVGYGIALSLLVFLAFFPVLDNGFTNYDDPSYVTSNRHVLEGLSSEGVRWAFSTFYFYNWHPLTWISHLLDVQLSGLNPMGHHLMSLLLHIVNTVLLFVLLQGMTGAPGRSACVAALFALHPLHVEPVAWVSGRKDVLAALFLFLSLFAYLWYARSAKAAAYALCVLLFIAGLMSKAMLVSYPLLLLLMDYWPLGRLRRGSPDAGGTETIFRRGTPMRLVLEKIPLMALSAGSGIVTYLAQSEGGAVSADSSLFTNAGNALWSYVAYIFKMFWPVGLSVYYPLASVSLWKVALALAVIVAISTTAVRAAGRFPWLAVGWFWYLIALSPVAGFVKIGQHAMADRYSYIPLIGLFLVVVWGGADLLERLQVPRAALAGIAVAVLASCSVLTYLQAGRWHDSVTLFRHALTVTENNALAHKNLGAALAGQGKYVEALRHATESLRIQPEPKEFVSQAWLYIQLGDYGNALESCRKSIALLPDNERAHFLSGVSYVYLGDRRSAIEEYEVLKSGNSVYADRLLDFMNSAGIVLPAS